MPLICFLQSIRRKVAETSRANLLQSTEIVRCCRIIIQEVHSTDFDKDRDFGSIESVFKKAEEALESARTNKSDVCEAFENVTNSIVEVGRSMQIDSLLDIQERMNKLKINDKHVGDQKSLRFHKHLKHLARSPVKESPRITIDIRVRRDIDDESKQEIIEIQGKGNDTLDIVLLSMKLNRSSRMWQNLHFYDRTFPLALKELVAEPNHRLVEPLPFDRVLSEIPRLSKHLVLYCLHDHESGNHILLRCQSLRSFTNLWKITLHSTFILKDVCGTIEHAERFTDVSHAEVRITTKHLSSGSVREEIQGVWPGLLRELHKSFGTAPNICWTIEVPHYSPNNPSPSNASKLAMPKPKAWLAQNNESSSTLPSITSTLVPSLPSAYVEKKGKPGRSSWFTALVEKFTV